MNFFKKLFETDFMPHGHCYFWQADILWPHVLGDGFTAVSYFLIPFLLYKFVRKRPDVKFRSLFIAFALFILFCGTTHMLAIVSVWHPIYRAEAVMKVLTALISVITVIALFRHFPTALAIPSSHQLIEANTRLQAEVDKRQYAEKEKKASETRFRAAMKFATVGMGMLSPDGQFIEVNAALCKMLGYDEQEFMKLNFTEITHPDDRSLGKEQIAQLKSREIDSFTLEKRYLRKDGEVVWALLGTTMIWKDNQPDYYISQIVDITQQKQAEEKMQQINRELETRVQQRTAELEEINQELEGFTYSVTHDLRLPLKNLEGFTSMLKENFSDQLDEVGQECVQHISDNALRMDQLIIDFLAFSKVGKQAINKAAFDIGAVFRKVYQELSVLYNKDKVDFEVADLPHAYGDASLIYQVCQNLVSNALKYSEKRERTKIEIGSYMQEDQVVYFVKDNGAGFDGEHQEKLFKIFQRLHSTEDFEGTGVGLALSHRIIKKHGGRMWAESKVEEGATFYFSLPATETERTVQENGAGHINA